MIARDLRRWIHYQPWSNERMRTFEVLLFAGLRQTAGSPSISVALATPATVADLLRAIKTSHPRLAEQVDHCRVAVDQTFVALDDSITHADEIALIPPVSGGHQGPSRIDLRSSPLDLADVVNAVDHAGAGGIATFTGNVRHHSRGQTIEYLDYEAYAPMAISVMTQIADQIEASISGTRVAIHHRVGRLDVGETAVVIAASAPHRAEAFEACREAIELLKRDVPIWKREVSTTGKTWIGQGP